jgi:hypothetical protein
VLWLTWLRRPAATAAARTVQIIGRSPRDRHTARGVAEALMGSRWVARERRVSLRASRRRCGGSKGRERAAAA